MQSFEFGPNLLEDEKTLIPVKVKMRYILLKNMDLLKTENEENIN